MQTPRTMIPERLRAEPYRILFPLGIAGAVIGIGVWIPHFLWPNLIGYPGQSHAVIQIQGFLLCFVFGFLCTMLPKVLGVAPLGSPQFLLFPLGLAGLVTTSLAGAGTAAQLFHLGLLANFLLFIGMRWPTRRANPPVFFVFIAAAMTADATGTALRILGLTGHGTAQTWRLGALLQYQAFPLLLILGVGGFLLPKLFAQTPVDPGSLRPSEASVKSLAAAATLFLVGFVVESFPYLQPLPLRLGAAIRAAVWGWFLFFPLRLHCIPAGLPAYLTGARFSLYAIGAGLLMPLLLPAYVLAWEHLIYVTGLLWLTLSVAARVLTAHGGSLNLLAKARKTTMAYGWLLVLAALTRAVTDIWTGGRGLHLALASGFALIALTLWTVLFAPLVFRFPGGGKK